MSQKQLNVESSVAVGSATGVEDGPGAAANAGAIGGLAADGSDVEGNDGSGSAVICGPGGVPESTDGRGGTGEGALSDSWTVMGLSSMGDPFLRRGWSRRKMRRQSGGREPS